MPPTSKLPFPRLDHLGTRQSKYLQLATITAGQERVATITTGLEETTTAQVTNTADGTTFTNSTGMGEDALANIAEAEAHMAHLIAAYQLATSTSALRTETEQQQAGD